MTNHPFWTDNQAQRLRGQDMIRYALWRMWKAYGFSLSELAKRSGVSRETISRIINDANRDISIDTAFKIMSCLNSDVVTPNVTFLSDYTLKDYDLMMTLYWPVDRNLYAQTGVKTFLAYENGENKSGFKWAKDNTNKKRN